MKDRGVTRDVWVGALVPVAITAAFLAFAYYGPAQQGARHWSYGTTFFLATPILQGVGAGVFSQCWGHRPLSVAANAMWLGLVLITAEFIVFRMEGIVCFLMAAPLVIPLAFLGTWIGWSARQWSPTAHLSLPTVAVLTLMSGGGQFGSTADESRGEVTTVWHVDAPPARVWPFVLRLSKVPAPDWWLFRLGVAYPVGTETLPAANASAFSPPGRCPRW